MFHITEYLQNKKESVTRKGGRDRNTSADSELPDTKAITRANGGDVHPKEALGACFDGMLESEVYLVCANLCHGSWLAYRL